jgi:hypothetical protein
MFSVALLITQCFTFTLMHPTIRLALPFAFPQYESRTPHLSQPMLFDFQHESSIFCCCLTSVYLIQFSAMLTDPLGHTPHFLEHYMLGYSNNFLLHITCYTLFFLLLAAQHMLLTAFLCTLLVLRLAPHTFSC